MKIKLTESKLRDIITESVKNVLKENNDLQGASYDLVDSIKMCMGSDELCNRLISRLAGQIDWRGVYETLQEIYNTECSTEVNESTDDDWDYQIDTADVSILKNVKSGKMSLKDAAREFHKLGWTNFVDVDATKRILQKAEQKY